MPLIVRYPGKVEANTVSAATTTLANLMATCAELLGNKNPKFETEDSYSIYPILTGKAKEVLEQPAVVHFSSKGFYAIRKGSWKLITNLGSGGMSTPVEIKAKPGEPIGQLFNLENDIHEDHNLYNENPEKVKELTEMLENIKKSKVKIKR